MGKPIIVKRKSARKPRFTEDEEIEFVIQNGCRLRCTVERRNNITVLRIRSPDGGILLLPDTANQVGVIVTRFK